MSMIDDEVKEARKTHDSDFHRARVAISIALTIIIGAILLIDAITVDYEVNPLVLVPMLGTIAALMSVELRALGGK